MGNLSNKLKVCQKGHLHNVKHLHLDILENENRSSMDISRIRT